MNITHELRKELVLMLGDAKELPYPVLEKRTRTSFRHAYQSDKHLRSASITPTFFHAVFAALRHEQLIARRVERGRPLYSLTPQGQQQYQELDTLYRLSVGELVA